MERDRGALWGHLHYAARVLALILATKKAKDENAISKRLRHVGRIPLNVVETTSEVNATEKRSSSSLPIHEEKELESK